MSNLLMISMSCYLVAMVKIVGNENIVAPCDHSLMIAMETCNLTGMTADGRHNDVGFIYSIFVLLDDIFSFGTITFDRAYQL